MFFSSGTYLSLILASTVFGLAFLDAFQDSNPLNSYLIRCTPKVVGILRKIGAVLLRFYGWVLISLLSLLSRLRSRLCDTKIRSMGWSSMHSAFLNPCFSYVERSCIPFSDRELTTFLHYRWAIHSSDLTYRCRGTVTGGNSSPPGENSKHNGIAWVSPDLLVKGRRTEYQIVILSFSWFHPWQRPRSSVSVAGHEGPFPVEALLNLAYSMNPLLSRYESSANGFFWSTSTWPWPLLWS